LTIFQDIIVERRKQGTFKSTQSDFIDLFLKKIEENRDVPNTHFTGETGTRSFPREVSIAV
jgi:hypothetical protein